MQKRWHYFYVIVYPALGYKFYYGSRITKKTPEEDSAYFGSSVTFAHYNDPTHADYQADAIKVVLWAAYLSRSRKNAIALSDRESQHIKDALHNVEYLGPEVCLNRNYAGRIVMTKAEQQAAIEKSLKAGSGFAGMDLQTRKDWAAVGGLMAKEAGKGIYALSEEALQKARDKGRKTIKLKYAKEYTFSSPEGEIVTFKNLNAFCRKNNLHPGHMRSVNCGRIKSHKGWRKPNT